MIDPQIASGRDRVWKASVIRSEIRSRAELTALCLCFCTLHANEIPRTDPLVQVDDVRVVDLDIGGEQIGQSARSEWSPFRSAPAELEPATAGLKQLWKTLSLPVVRRPIAKEQHYDRGFESFPRYQSCDFARQTTIFCDLVRSM